MFLKYYSVILTFSPLYVVAISELCPSKSPLDVALAVSIDITFYI
jgi:hypothetical protein